MWPTIREQHNRKTSRFQSDLTDKEWRVIEPYLPAAKRADQPRAWPMRKIINGIFYEMRSGCTWRELANDFPPWSTIYHWFAMFRDNARFASKAETELLPRCLNDSIPLTMVVRSTKARIGPPAIIFVRCPREMCVASATALQPNSPTASRSMACN